MTEPVRRVHYFSGQVLSSEDFQVEQDYHRGMRHLHNRLHGWGVAEGFGVTAADDEIVVEPGIAIDALGREIVATEQCRLAWGRDSGDVDVWVTWAEEPDAFVIGGNPDEPSFSRWLERPRLSLEQPGFASTESLLLARVSPAEDGSITVDTSARRLLGPPPSPAAS